VKVRGYLRRQGVEVARCTVERLMRANGWRGNSRGRRKVVTTTPDPGNPRHPDLAGRDFRAAAPGRLLVADFTYVPLAGGGFGYTAFVFDAFAGTILGWECSLSRADGVRAAGDRAGRGGAAPRGRRPGHLAAGTSQRRRVAGRIQLVVATPRDHGGVRWQDHPRGRPRSVRCQRGDDGSGLRIGRCDLRCDHRAGRSPRVRCSGSSGG